jgi:thiamine-phosphate pyrophosphorylase
MPKRCLLYYITDRSQFEGDENARRRALLEKIAEAGRAGIDYIQLREKDLSSRELELLAEEAVRIIRDCTEQASGERGVTRLLINSRTDIALATGADGVHLRSNDIAVSDVRRIVAQARGRPLKTGDFMITASCHSKREVEVAESDGVNLAVFAPVFGKKDAPGAQPKGIAGLQEACTAAKKVLALGGVTLENAALCLGAGAAGIAGIRLFQENRIEDVVRALRGI